MSALVQSVDFSVVVPTIGRNQEILRLLKSLEKLTLQGIVVNQSSDGRVKKVIESRNCHISESEAQAGLATQVGHAGRPPFKACVHGIMGQKARPFTIRAWLKDTWKGWLRLIPKTARESPQTTTYRAKQC
jgi:hypothetical protein